MSPAAPPTRPRPTQTPPAAKMTKRPAQTFSTDGAAGDVDAETLDRAAAAMLPGELLQPGEIILLLLKPSPWFILLVPLRLVLSLCLLTCAAVMANRVISLGLAERDIILLGVGMIGLRLFWEFLEWLSRTYVLTDQRIIRVSGVLTIRVFETRLENIQHTDLIFTVRERLFSLGTLTFATAGTALAEATWEMVSSPLEVHQRVMDALRRYRR